MTKRTRKLVKDFERAAWKAGHWETQEFGDSAREAAQRGLDAVAANLMKNLGSLVTDRTRALLRELEVAAREAGRFETLKTKKSLDASRSALMQNLRYIIDGNRSRIDIEALVAILNGEKIE